MLKKSFLLLSLSLVLLFQGCSSDTESEADNAMVATTDYVLKDTAGETYTVHKEAESFILNEHQKGIVLYDIFATWCPPCRAEAPHLASLQKKYPNDLLILGISIEEDITAAKLNEFKDKYEADYRITYGKASIDLSRIIASTIHIGQQFPIPLMVMYKDGKYVTHYAGAIPEEMIESDIKQALGR
ncbi:MAG: TlpA disulfide reductase family protein [Campylobacterota bacterium]|nr:TlpA disulfide reductase family protein [Campylobacterota bacterium]